MSRRRREALEAVVKKRRQILARRKKSDQHRRRVWRRYLREPFWDLKTYLFVDGGTVGASTSTVPSLDEVLGTIRKAWEPPREQDRDEKVEEADMGTGQGMSRKQVPANPGLPHRRYSVPETVMRKYTLTKQHSESSDSGVATVPVVTPDTISSNPLPSSSSEEKSSSDSSDHSGGKIMGNRASRKNGSRKSPIPNKSTNNNQPTRSSLDTVTEEINDLAKGKTSVDTLDRISSIKEDYPSSANSGILSSKSKSPIKQEREAERTSEDIPDLADRDKSERTTAEVSSPPTDDKTPHEPPSSERDEVTSSQTLNIVSTESNLQSSNSIEKETKSIEAQIVEQNSEHAEETIDSNEQNGCTSVNAQPNSPSSPTESLEPQTSKDELSSSQTLGLESTESKPQSISNKDDQQKSTESFEPCSSKKEDLSSSQTPYTESSNSKECSKTNKEKENPPESSETQDELSASKSPEMENSSIKSDESENRKATENSPNSTESVEPQSSNRDELSSSQTMESRPESSKARSSRSNSRKDLSAQSKRSKGRLSRHSSSLGMSPQDTEDTVEPESTLRDELSSSQTMGVGSTESRASSNPNKESQDRTRSSTPGGDVSFTPTECCISTPDPDRSQSMSSASDRASESCSITPVGQTSESSTSGSSPERPSVTLRSSPEQPSSDHTSSTQDATLSIKSDPIILGRPVSVLARRGEPNKQSQISDSEQSMGHIEFMNDNVENESHPLLDILGSTSSEIKKLEKSQSSDSNSQQTGDSGHATEPECKTGEFCGTSKLNDAATKSIHPFGETVPVTEVATDTDYLNCSHQTRSWEIIIQPTTIVQNNSRKCLEVKNEIKNNKLAILPSKSQEGKFCGTKTYLVIRPGGSTGLTSRQSTSGSSKPQPMAASHDIEVFKSPNSPAKGEDVGPYSWSRLSEEERMVRMQHQRHRLWMNRKISAANELPSSPLHGPLTYGVGTGSTYRKSFDTQLVVPRYSALPRSVSMLVNTSSGECSSNSNSDSECLSLVDSLEERPTSIAGKHKPSKHDSKPVRGDIVQLLPEETTKQDLHKRINPATPRGKGKAFFVSMAGGLDEVGKVEVVENVEKPDVSQSMPDRLKKKLSQRHQQMELKKKKKRLKGQDEDTENIVNIYKQNYNSQDTGSKKVPLLNAQAQSSLENIQNIPQQVLVQAEIILTDQNTTKRFSHRRNESISQSLQNDTPKSQLENVGQENSQVEVPVRVRKMTTAIFHPMQQEGTTNGTFIVSRKEGQKEKESKVTEQELNDVSANDLQQEHMKKEDIPEERSPPVKRFRASRKQKSPKSQQEIPLRDFLNSLRNGKVGQQDIVQNEQKPEISSSNPENQHTMKEKENNTSLDPSIDKTMEHKEKQSPASPEGKIGDNQKEIVPTESSIVATTVQKETQTKPTKSRKKIQKEYKPTNIPSSSEVTNPISNEKAYTKEQKTEESRSEKLPQNEKTDKSTDKITNKEKLSSIGKVIVKESPSPDSNVNIYKQQENVSKPNSEILLEDRNTENKETQKSNNDKVQKTEKKIETKNKDIMKKDKDKKSITKRTSPPTDSVQYQEIEYSNKTDVSNPEKETKKEPSGAHSDDKALSTVSCQTSPQPKPVKEQSTSAPATPPETDKTVESSSNPKLNLQLKSAIPIMKSPVSARKLSPDTAITMHHSLQRNSHLPVRRTSRLLHPPPVRRSANLLGARFQQRFEVIPEERSISLESSTEDQNRQTNDRARRSSLSSLGSKPIPGERPIVSHSCLGYNQTSTNPIFTKYRQNVNSLHRQSAVAKESSSSNNDESSSSPNNIETSNSNTIKPVIRKPSYQSRIPRAEKSARQSKANEKSETKEQDEKKQCSDYQGKAALGPHNEDNDLLSISKGWINFYLLKDGRGTPDSICSEAPGDASDKEDRLTRRKRHVPITRTVTVVGGEDDRIRQYTVPSRVPQSPEDVKRNIETSTTLPDLNSNSSSRRHSLEKLPITVIEPNDSPADSDHSTTYMCLPSPRFKHPNLLEGSGELACSESSVSSSSDSECDKSANPAVIPLRWPNRQHRRGPPNHRSRSRSKHYKSDQFQSFFQSGGNGGGGK
ncbi:hypothetical protein C0J52_10001 [Blattella germanica]|nr:hypothetical protein C0J52_10001 [Blattella germanica]